MSWVLDGAVVVVAAVFLILGVRRGFIKSAIRLIGMAVALVAAAWASSPLAAWIFDSFLAAPLQSRVAQHTADAAVTAAQTVQEQMQAILDTLPAFVKSAFDLSGMTLTQSGSAVAAESLTQMMMESVVRPLCLSLLQAVLFLLLFIVIYWITQWIGRGVNKVFTTLPIIRQINGLLGGVLGLAEGVAVVYLLTFVLRLYMTMSGASSAVTTADIEATQLLRPIMEFHLFH